MEGQCLNTADREMLTSVGEANSCNSVTRGGNRDARAGTVVLLVEEHRIAARAGDRIAAMRPDMDLIVVAAGHQRAASASGVACAADKEYVVATRAVEILLAAGAAVQSNSVEMSAFSTSPPPLPAKGSVPTTSNQQIIRATPGCEYIAAAAAADQSSKVAGVIKH